MKLIKSFTIDHDRLTPGFYISRVDGDVVTYDLRLVKPNAGRYPSSAALHSMEHLLATYCRNSELSDSVVYVGPMGCRTGFYLLFRDSVGPLEALELTKRALAYCAGYEGTVPGAAASRECGNWLEQDLEGAKAEALSALTVLEGWGRQDMEYPE